MRRLFHALLCSLCLMLSGCGGGVPITLLLDRITFRFAIEDYFALMENDLNNAGLLSEGTALPEHWPDDLPDVCYEVFGTSSPEEGRIDLTPEVDPKAVEQFESLNDGTVERLEIQELLLRVEQNTLNIGIPPFEILAADAIDANPGDRRAWFVIGDVGGGLNGGCNDQDRVEILGPGEFADLPLLFRKRGRSFIENEIADVDCPGSGERDDLRCKEFSLGMRTRIVFDTREERTRPRGEVHLRVILVAIAHVNPL